MRNLIAAYTKTDSTYPGYVNVSSEDGTIIVTVRSDPTINEGNYICGETSSVKLSEEEWKNLLNDLNK